MHLRTLLNINNGTNPKNIIQLKCFAQGALLEKTSIGSVANSKELTCINYEQCFQCAVSVAEEYLVNLFFKLGRAHIILLIPQHKIRNENIKKISSFHDFAIKYLVNMKSRNKTR